MKKRMPKELVFVIGLLLSVLVVGCAMPVRRGPTASPWGNDTGPPYLSATYLNSREMGYYCADYSNDFDATLAAANADTSGGAVIVNKACTYDADSATSSDSDVAVIVTDQGSITETGEVAALTVGGDFICPVNHQAFISFETGDLSFSKGTKFCPEWVGAARDGSTDDATEIQFANDVVEGCVGTLVLSEGTYPFASDLTINTSKITWSGAGANTILAPSTTTANIIIDGADDCTLENFCISLPSQYATSAIELAGDASGVQHNKLLNLHIKNDNTETLEHLSETAFATHALWGTVGDFDDTGGNAVYAHSGGTGTLTQTSGNMNKAAVGGDTYTFWYTVSGAAGDPTAAITTAFASVSTSLTLTDGAQSTTFTAAAAPGSFIVSSTSDSGDDTFTLDDVSLSIGDNGESGILFDANTSYVSFNHISNCTFKRLRTALKFGPSGSWSNGNVIDSCVIDKCVYGIYMDDANGNTHGNMFSNVTIQNNPMTNTCIRVEDNYNIFDPVFMWDVPAKSTSMLISSGSTQTVYRGYITEDQITFDSTNVDIDTPTKVIWNEDIGISGSTPAVTFWETNGTDFESQGTIYGDLTDTGSGSEDCDFFFRQKIAGTQRTYIGANADGNITIGYGTQDVVATSSFIATATTETFTTEGNITDPLPSNLILLDGDDDSDDDAIDLQDGTTGEIVQLVASADIDADDTCTINMADTTCTNCPAIVFDKVGENATLLWTGSTWVVTELQDSL